MEVVFDHEIGVQELLVGNAPRHEADGRSGVVDGCLRPDGELFRHNVLGVEDDAKGNQVARTQPDLAGGGIAVFAGVFEKCQALQAGNSV